MKHYKSKAEADDAWANAAYVPEAQDIIDSWETNAAEYREKLLAEGRAQINIPYGDGERHGFDVFLPEGTPKGMMVFIHGGYWIRFDRSYWSHFAQGANENGWAVAMPSYDLCPTVGIPEITKQITRAIETVSAQNPDLPLIIAGHSAGGHLTARMLEPGRFAPEIEQRITRAVPISPVADLRPIMETSMNEQFKLDQATATAESPIAGQNSLDIPITVWVGNAERPVFIEQATTLSKNWECDLMLDAGKHHFDVIDGLKDANSDLTKTVLGL